MITTLNIWSILLAAIHIFLKYKVTGNAKNGQSYSMLYFVNGGIWVTGRISRAGHTITEWTNDQTVHEDRRMVGRTNIIVSKSR